MTEHKPPTFRQLLHSVLAAALGVQSSQNRERDFSQGNPIYFLVLGALFTVVLVAVLIGIAKAAIYLGSG